MPTLKYWRVLYVDSKPMLAALEVYGHPYIPCGPIITNTVVQGQFAEGETVITKSGTNYTLDAQLDESDDCEFARPLLIERVSKNLIKNNSMLKLEQLDQLNLLIDKILAGEKM